MRLSLRWSACVLPFAAVALLAQEGGQRSVTVSAYKYGFTPNRIEVGQDDLVRITFSTKDIPHSFTIDRYRIAKRVEPGRSVVFEFRADQPGRFPIIDAGNLPFMISNAKGGSQALDEWYRKYAGSEMKDVKFCLGFVHDYGSFHSKTKKIVVPGDVKGMKIRPAHAIIATLVTELGGTNVQASAPEVRDIIEKGVADAVTFPWGSVPLFGIDKVTKYHMNVPLYVTSFAWVMNKAKYEEMSPAQKKVIDDHCNNEWALRVAAPWADFERAGVAKLQADTASGREVYTISEAQLGEWKKAAEPVVKAWGDSVRKAGGDPDEALKGLKESLAKHNAGY